MIHHPRRFLGTLAMIVFSFAGLACSNSPGDTGDAGNAPAPDPMADPAPMGVADGKAVAIFAGGCFWCTEVVFEKLDGVEDVVSGYAGGSASTANYRAISTGNTDHAEAIRIEYDPEKITYSDLLKVFFTVAHDPTQLNRQGPDVGRQYRSAVFYQSPAEKAAVEAYIEKLEAAETFDDPIVTTLEPFEGFYVAEQYHQDYAQRNPDQPYIRYNALPKVEKLREKFGGKMQDQ